MNYDFLILIEEKAAYRFYKPKGLYNHQTDLIQGICRRKELRSTKKTKEMNRNVAVNVDLRKLVSAQSFQVLRGYGLARCGTVGEWHGKE